MNAQSDTNTVGTQAPVTRTDASPEGVPMADESGSGCSRGPGKMRFLRKNSNWVNMIIAILACPAVVAVVLLIAPQPEVELQRVVDDQSAIRN